MTLEELSKATGLTRSYVSKVDFGSSGPSTRVALKLAQALNVPMGRVSGGSSTVDVVSNAGLSRNLRSASPRIVAGTTSITEWWRSC
ncbi:helix-turn-helix domain-containing protein [Pseudoroseomonas globiformis]|uniref:Helix-turn-helix domain-containing protein n=1 Tax=Teichococcus globiformis TaxID=2307229 RepID=A0ABV7FYP9_9PROT